MTSTSGRSRTIRSPSATCCLTIAYSSSVRLARLAQDLVRDADLADVVEQPGDADRGDLLGRPARAARRGRRRSGRRPRSAASCSGPWCRPRGSAPGRRRSVRVSTSGSTVRPGHPDGIAAARLGLLERSAPWRSAGPSPSRAWSGNRQTPALTVSGRRSDASNWSEWSASTPGAARGRRIELEPTDPAGATTRNSSGP